MTNKSIGLLVVVLVLVLAGSSEAQGLFPPQIKYELEVWELQTEEEHQFALEAFEWQSSSDLAAYGLEVLTSPNLSTILAGIPIRLVAQSSAEQKARVATPGILVRLGQVANLRVVEETLLPETVSEEPYYKLDGIELTISPLISDGEQAVFTNFAINTYQSRNRVTTNLWLESGERTPLAMVRLQSESTNITSDRFFALYVHAEIITEPPTTTAIAIGGLGGLDKLLWQADAQPQPSNYVWVALPLTPLTTPEAAFRSWVTPRFYIDGAFRGTTYDSHLAVGLKLFPEGLNLETRIIANGDEYFIAVGFSDRLEAIPGLVLAGGFLPGVFQLSDYQRAKMRWWGEAEFMFKPVSLRMRYLSGMDDSGTIESEIGYDLEDKYNLFVRLSMNQKQGNKVAAGVRLTF